MQFLNLVIEELYAHRNTEIKSNVLFDSFYLIFKKFCSTGFQIIMNEESILQSTEKDF